MADGPTDLSAIQSRTAAHPAHGRERLPNTVRFVAAATERR